MKFGREILLLLIGGIIAFSGSYAIQFLGNKIPYIDKYVHSEKSVISKKNLFSNDVKILVGPQEVSNVSKASLYLFNYSDKFFKDLEVSIQFDEPSDDFKVLNMYVAGENQQTSMVEVLPTEDDNLFNYKVKSAKRTDSYDEFLQLVIYYEGMSDITEDNFTVTVVNDEARVRKFEKSHSPEDTVNKAQSALIMFVLVCGVVVFMFAFLWFFSRLTRGADRKFAQKYSRSMLDASGRVELLRSIPLNQRAVIVPDLIYEYRLQRWKDMNILQRFLEGNIPPQKSDLELKEVDEPDSTP
ncbi:hypothetical protein AB6D77_02160 [Vibrio splendidus]